MKIEELMVGDLVQVAKDVCIKKGTIVKVRSIDGENSFPEKGLKGCASCVSLDDRTLSGGVWVEYLNPIPLTVEILEKNGFVIEWDEDVKLMVCDTIKIEIGDRYQRYKDGKMYLRRLLSPLYYVHELQHALKLCGIDKEIVL